MRINNSMSPMTSFNVGLLCLEIHIQFVICLTSFKSLFMPTSIAILFSLNIIFYLII